jgi:hypothetical protein
LLFVFIRRQHDGESVPRLAGFRMSGRGGESCHGVQAYLDWVCVSVVVVVTGAGTVVCSVEVVELCVALSVSQPVSDKRAAVAKQEMISFFISIFVVWFVVLQAHNYAIGWSLAIRCNPTT